MYNYPIGHYRSIAELSMVIATIERWLILSKLSAHGHGDEKMLNDVRVKYIQVKIISIAL
jgi:hypothetical protein